jgi:8-oxo-dGTP pyrophosphatase MutT (NUDIX family)
MDDRRAGWRRVHSDEGPDYGIFRVRLDTAISPRTGAAGRYVVLECPDWVNMIALTDERQIVLIRQYRHGIDRVALELPSGTIERGEDPLEAAQRELAEETGYTSDHWTLLGLVLPNPAFQDNRSYHFLAEGARRTVEPALDPGETIDVELYPLSELHGLIATGQLDQALVLSAVYWFERRPSPAL